MSLVSLINHKKNFSTKKYSSKEEIVEDLQNFVYGGLPNFEEYEGVFNDGENGYRGNEGIIVFSDNKIQIPREKKNLSWKAY